MTFEQLQFIFTLNIEPWKENMEIHEAMELIAYLHFDGKIEQGSKFESKMCDTVISQIKTFPDLSHRTLALCWIYFLAHAREPLGQSIMVNSICYARC